MVWWISGQFSDRISDNNSHSFLLLTRNVSLTSGQRFLTKSRIAGVEGCFTGDIEQSGTFQQAFVPLLTIGLNNLLLHSPQQRLPMLYSGPDKPQNCPFSWGSRPHLIMVPWAHASQPSDGIFIGSAVFCMEHSCDQQTDRQTNPQTNTRPRYMRHL